MGSGMAPLMFPSLQHYMSRLGMGIGPPALPSIPNPMHLPRLPLLDQAMTATTTPNQVAVCPTTVINPMNYQNQLQNSSFSEQYASYLGFHQMQNNSQVRSLISFQVCVFFKKNAEHMHYLLICMCVYIYIIY